MRSRCAEHVDGSRGERRFVFQIASITKVWTATLVMQLFDDGLLDLDAPVRTVLAEFRLADPDAARRITPRQLLSHTAGFAGDLLIDTGPGDDCLERLVAALGNARQLFEPGRMFSYNNAGYCVLGRLIEVVRDRPYDQCLREWLIEPLGLTHAATSAAEAILHRAAIGHVGMASDGVPRPAPIWALPRAYAPAGSLLAMRVRDLIAFAEMHLANGGRAARATILRAASASAMRERHVELPYLAPLGDAWGLGWEIFDSEAGPMIGHDGDTVGQSAFLCVVPDRDVAVAVLANGGNARALFSDVVGVELRPPSTPAPSSDAVDATRYLGRYTSEMADTSVTEDGNGRVWLERRPKGVFAQFGGEVERFEILPYKEDVFVSAAGKEDRHAAFAFVGGDAVGRAEFLHTGRAEPRADD
jgi:CubicO group peptidase (beta-lactamase class C family)